MALVAAMLRYVSRDKHGQDTQLFSRVRSAAREHVFRFQPEFIENQRWARGVVSLVLRIYYGVCARESFILEGFPIF
jgi:hypothetical protein